MKSQSGTSCPFCREKLDTTRSITPQPNAEEAALPEAAAATDEAEGGVANPVADTDGAIVATPAAGDESSPQQEYNDVGAVYQPEVVNPYLGQPQYDGQPPPFVPEHQQPQQFHPHHQGFVPHHQQQQVND